MRNAGRKNSEGPGDGSSGDSDSEMGEREAGGY